MGNTYTEIARARAAAETYAGKMDRIAAELLDVLRDILGPKRRLPEPRASYARYGDHEVTVRDGEGGRVEVTAHLTTAGTVKEYSARLTHGDRDSRPWAAVGPLRTDCSEDPEEHPTLTYVLPLVTRLRLAEEKLERARQALEAAGHPVEDCGPSIVLREPCAWGMRNVATVELNPDNGALRVHGRDAGQVREILYQAKVF
uniref:Uncharacterized protein n=1 Tax=Myoviridae sp. cte0t5 TaxID=2823549 RepID=A0A8S5LHC5_9CAUD|nr:MAG TPA: hypothetical protein [Myoviridae sp. cte0t5]